jgi:Domain of unknown function (DUF4345)/Polyketide cyclase / dehydrase and lipid transport
VHNTAATAVHAAVDAVRHVLVDVENWPRWTPTMTEVRLVDTDALRAGARVRIRHPGMPPFVWRVDTLTPGTGFSWTTALRGGQTRATHELCSGGRGHTCVMLGLRRPDWPPSSPKPWGGIPATTSIPRRRRCARSASRKRSNAPAGAAGAPAVTGGSVESLLRWLAAAMGVTCTAIGLTHFTFGINSVPGERTAGATVDSRERFFAAIFVGYGAAWFGAARQTPTPVPLIRRLTASSWSAGSAA